jgi:5-methyltetrahydropteroyltriglutamate--homocysteine methyltransferase
MQIFSKNHSSYPRVGDRPEQQKLRRAYNQFDKRKITADEVAKILDETVTEIIEEQKSSGCDFITDGQIRTYDPLSSIAAKIKGFEITGLLRFFDTNFLYRQPKVVDKLQYVTPLVADDYSFIKELAGDKASAVMIGPYSLLKMSITDGKFIQEFESIAEIYAKELGELKARGAALVQLDEPAIIFNTKDFGLFQSLYKGLRETVDVPEILIALYFGNATPYVDQLAKVAVDGILFDFTYSPGLKDALKGFDKNIGLGILNGRNTRMEKPDKAIKEAESILKEVKSKNAYITSSCGLEFLPRNRAFDKLKLSAEITGRLRGGR